jgi:hypothetical protein
MTQRTDLNRFSRTARDLLRNDRTSEIPAFLGNLSGVVEADTSGNVYVTLFNGEVKTVFNGRVPNVPRLPVVIGYGGSDKLQVLRSRDVYPNAPYPDIPSHASLHTFPAVDTVPVRSEQFLPGLVTPSTGLTVRVYGTPYELSDGWHVLATQDLNLTSYLPVSGALYALIEADNTGALIVTKGVTVASRAALTYADIPTPDPSRYALAAVKLYVGQTTILFLPNQSDILDLRFGKLGTFSNAITNLAEDLIYMLMGA